MAVDHRAVHVGHRDGLHVVDVATLEADPRRRQVHRARLTVARADEAVLPVGAATGRRARHARRLGATGRLGRHDLPPGEQLGVGQRVVAALELRLDRTSRGRTRRSRRWSGTRTRRRRRPARRARRTARPGSPHALERERQQQLRLRRAGVADVAARSVGDRPAELLGQHAAGPGMRGRDDDLVDVVGRDAGGRERVAPGLAWRARRSAARRTSPPTASCASRRACATGRGTPTSPRRRRGTSAIGSPLTDQQRGAGIATRRLVGRARQADADVGGHHERRVGRARARRAARRCPTAASRPRRTPRPTSTGAARRGTTVAFVFSRYGGRGRREPQHRRRRRAGRRAQREAAGLDREGGGVLVVGGDGPGALARPDPWNAAMAERWSRQYGT